MEDIGIKDYKYKVATRCFTYNHAPYITEALRGFAMQVTNFPSVYIIVDDASTDGEPEVIRAWVLDNLDCGEVGLLWKEMPYGQLAVAPLKDKPLSTFVILLLSENHYQTGKSLKRFDYISEWFDNAKYHALCEGDDYWTNPHKLQKQVAYMEQNESCILCYGKARCFIQSKLEYSDNIYGKDFVSFEKLLFENTVPTLTEIIRKEADDKYRQEFNSWGIKWRMGDFPQWLWCARNGKCHFFDEVFGVYRILEESASHTKSIDQQISFFNDFRDIQLFFVNKYNVPKNIYYLIQCRNNYTLMKLLLNKNIIAVFKPLFLIPCYFLLYLITTTIILMRK